jgi:hypothetical protein
MHTVRDIGGTSGFMSCGMQLLKHLEFADGEVVAREQLAIKGARDPVVTTHQVVPRGGQLLVV